MEAISVAVQFESGRRATAVPLRSCRIGIATVAVVIGDLIGEGAAQEQGAVGETPTPTLAARLQTLADKLVRTMQNRTVMQQPSAQGPGLTICCSDILGTKIAPVDAAKGLTDLRRYPDATRFSSNGYFFFFLADFFAFFAFLAMLPSVTPKLAQCKPTFDMHSFRLHHDYKIDTASFKEGKRPATSSRLAPQTKLARHAWTLRA
jgi:hypothetical protein